jgi:FMN-dependent NADH-azoreductase
MKKILHIVSSPRGEASNSIKLGEKVVEKLQERYPESTVTTNNVVEKDYDHLTGNHLAGYFTPADTHSADTAKAVQPSDEAVDQLHEADFIVISLPMYNFNMPSALKAWIDHIARAGKTFSYQTGVPEGLLLGKKVYLAIASSGVYSDGLMKDFDFAEPYLRYILGFLGLKDITTFRVEGAAIPGVMETALEKGLSSVAV